MSRNEGYSQQEIIVELGTDDRGQDVSHVAVVRGAVCGLFRFSDGSTIRSKRESLEGIPSRTRKFTVRHNGVHNLRHSHTRVSPAESKLSDSTDRFAGEHFVEELCVRLALDIRLVIRSHPLPQDAAQSRVTSARNRMTEASRLDIESGKEGMFDEVVDIVDTAQSLGGITVQQLS